MPRTERPGSSWNGLSELLNCHPDSLSLENDDKDCVEYVKRVMFDP